MRKWAEQNTICMLRRMFVRRFGAVWYGLCGVLSVVLQSCVFVVGMFVACSARCAKWLL